MAILGITNRTENWETAETFAPFIADGGLRLNLVQRLGEPAGTLPDEVEFELFWTGMRDNFKETGRKMRSDGSVAKDIAGIYNRLFPNLRQEIYESRLFASLKDWNYDANREGGIKKLRDNVCNTEIDLVLETPNRLFIGEAKSESPLSANGHLALVHQLIRQYVSARILVDLLGCVDKEVTPFVIAANTASLNRHGQVKFMVQQGWMKKTNVLGWDEIPH